MSARSRLLCPLCQAEFYEIDVNEPINYLAHVEKTHTDVRTPLAPVIPGATAIEEMKRVTITCGCGQEFPDQDPNNANEYAAHLETAHPIEALKRAPTQVEAEAEIVGLYREHHPLQRGPGLSHMRARGGALSPGPRQSGPGQIPLTRPDLSQLPEVVRAAQATSAALQRENERIYDKLPHHELVMALLDRDSMIRLRDSENAALRVEIARVKLKAARLSTRQHNMVHKATEAFYLAGSAFLQLVKRFDDEQQKSHKAPEPTAGDVAAYRVATEAQGQDDLLISCSEPGCPFLFDATTRKDSEGKTLADHHVQVHSGK